MLGSIPTLLPQRDFIAVAVHGAMVPSTEGDNKLIAVDKSRPHASSDN
jgi:hypothetical protein